MCFRVSILDKLGSSSCSTIITLQQYYQLIFSIINFIQQFMTYFLLLKLTKRLILSYFCTQLENGLNQRYTQLSRTKKGSIFSFISYLKTKVQKYKLSFAFLTNLHRISPQIVRAKVGHQFYEECQSIAKGAEIPISDIIVFNYMYQLGAATDFCTAITVSSQTEKILGRNLDYGYQEYLANNSVHIKYIRKGEVVFQTLGHAGFVGTHTSFKRSTTLLPLQFAATMNERVQGGLHLTLEKIIMSHCETSPYALIRALKEAKGDIFDFVRYLNNINTCTAVYWTILSKEGNSYVIQKNRGVGAHLIRQSNSLDGINYIVQTNHDFEKPDPDNRSTEAIYKLTKQIQSNSNFSDGIYKILTQSPNFNNLTLMTSIIDVKNGQISYKVWT